MKINITKEWIEKQARLEDGCEVTAGSSTTQALEAEIARKQADHRRKESPKKER